MIAKLKEISEGAYDLNTALAYTNTTQEDLNTFRQKAEAIDHVPNSILDRQVSENL